MTLALARKIERTTTPVNALARLSETERDILYAIVRLPDESRDGAIASKCSVDLPTLRRSREKLERSGLIVDADAA